MKRVGWGKRVLIMVAIGIASIVTIIVVFSKTPRNVNIQPVQQFRLSGDFTEIAGLAQKFAVEVQRDKWDDSKAYIVASLPKGRPENELSYVSRSVNIFQFSTRQGAQKSYVNHKRIFAKEGGGRLYEEGGTENDKYFTAYEPVHLDYNHSLPCGIVTSPDITAVFLKNNLLILISYSGLKNYDNYVKEMNEDIAYVGEILKDNVR